MHSTTEPSTTMPCMWFSWKKRKAWMGFTEARMSGRSMMATTPSAAMTENQAIMSGPKTLPMRSVPCFCMRNRMIRIRQVPGRMNGPAWSVATSRPSMAESTEMAGVMMPSPYNSAAPKMARVMSTA